jgi:hypothetical protein
VEDGRKDVKGGRGKKERRREKGREREGNHSEDEEPSSLFIEKSRPWRDEIEHTK